MSHPIPLPRLPLLALAFVPLSRLKVVLLAACTVQAIFHLTPSSPFPSPSCSLHLLFHSECCFVATFPSARLPPPSYLCIEILYLKAPGSSLIWCDESDKKVSRLCWTFPACAASSGHLESIPSHRTTPARDLPSAHSFPLDGSAEQLGSRYFCWDNDGLRIE